MTTTDAEVLRNPSDGSEHIPEESFMIYLKYLDEYRQSMKQNPVLLLQMFQISNSWGIRLSCFSCPRSNILITAATARWFFFVLLKVPVLRFALDYGTQ